MNLNTTLLEQKSATVPRISIEKQEALWFAVASFLLHSPLLFLAIWHDEFYRSEYYLHPGILTEATGFSFATDWTRQILVHPPGVNLFYLVWTSLFSSSEIALRVPAIVASTLSIYLFYTTVQQSGLSIRNSRFLTTSLLLCFSFIWYGAQAVYAPFELLAGLLCLQQFLYFLDSRKITKSFLAVHIVTALTCYQIVAFFLIELLFVFKSSNQRRSLFVLACITALTIAITIGLALSSHGLRFFPHWKGLAEGSALYWLALLPSEILTFQGVTKLELTTRTLCHLLYGATVSLGGFLCFFKVAAPIAVRFSAMLCSFVVLIYLTIHYFSGGFGHARNLYFLLPFSLLLSQYFFLQLSRNGGFFLVLLISACSILGANHYKSEIARLLEIRQHIWLNCRTYPRTPFYLSPLEKRYYAERIKSRHCSAEQQSAEHVNLLR